MDIMNTYWMAILTLGVLVNAVVLWRLRCVHVAHWQRTAVIDACSCYEDIAAFHAAPSYRDHIKQVFWLRDPWSLYGDLGNRARAIYKG